MTVTIGLAESIEMNVYIGLVESIEMTVTIELAESIEMNVTIGLAESIEMTIGKKANKGRNIAVEVIRRVFTVLCCSLGYY